MVCYRVWYCLHFIEVFSKTTKNKRRPVGFWCSFLAVDYEEMSSRRAWAEMSVDVWAHMRLDMHVRILMFTHMLGFITLASASCVTLDVRFRFRFRP